ncbi:unnamed protein product [Camellia sinensis]
MVNLMLMITAELENLTNLQPQGGCDDPNFTYYFKMRCGNCGEVTQKETCVSLNETVSLHQGKNTTNLVQKCKFCGRDGTVTMITGRGRPLTQEMSQSGKHTPLMLFDCRGYEPVEFLFGSGWKVESLKGTKFDDVDLSEGEFAEYDEKGECPVTISNLHAVFNVVKQLIVCGLVYVSTGNRGGAIASCKSLLVRIWNGNQQTRWALICIDSRSSVQSLTKSIPKVQFKVIKDDALKMYSSTVTLQTMDNIFYEAQRQGRMSFYLTSYGEDAINIASAAALTQDDIILPQVADQLL